LSSDVTFFMVYVEDITGRSSALVKKSVQVDACSETIIVAPDEPPPGIRTTIEAGGIISDLISIATPLVVMQHIGDATTITNDNTGLQLTNYQTLQSKPDKYAEIILGIEGQTITTVALQDRFGLPESNNNANVFLQISHTGSEINSMRGVELGGDKVMIISGDGNKVELPKSAEIAIPDANATTVTKKISNKLHDNAKLIDTPPAVLNFLNINIEFINEMTGQSLTHYVVLQTVPDKFAQEELGISGQKVTTLAFYDRYGLPESNEDLNVFLQISHTDEQVNSLRGVELGGDDISVIVNGIDQGIITKTKEVPMK